MTTLAHWKFFCGIILVWYTVVHTVNFWSEVMLNFKKGASHLQMCVCMTCCYMPPMILEELKVLREKET